MISYNVTVKIDSDVRDEWLEWMIKKHIPDVMATGLFIEYRMGRILGMDDEQGVNYTIQYYLENVDKLKEYQEKHAEAFQKEHSEKYKDRFVAFRTIMHLVATGN